MFFASAFLSRTVTSSRPCFIATTAPGRSGFLMGRAAKNGKAPSSRGRLTLKDVKCRRARARKVFVLKASAALILVVLAGTYLARQRNNRLLVQRSVRRPGAKSEWAPVYGIIVKRDFPHDIQAFTQGLTFYDGFLYESTGLHKLSSLRQIAPDSGEIVDMRKNNDDEFAEGVALGDVNGKELMQVIWKIGKGYIWNRDGLVQRASFGFDGDAWGIAQDGNGLFYMSDGSSRIRVFRRRDDRVEKVRDVAVLDGGKEVSLLNELEIIDGELWANIWFSDLIAIIDVQTGTVQSWVQCRGLLKPEYVPDGHTADVLNGIAYDSAQKRIFVTGKLWPRFFEIEVSEKKVASSVRTQNPFFMNKEKVAEIMQSI